MAYNFQEYNEKVQKTFDHLKQELGSLRTGKATPQLLDPVSVEAYGTRMKIHEVANVSSPDATLIQVSPWDKSLLGSIEKGILEAQLNLNPVVDGDIIRIAVPPLTEERRKDMVKLLYQKLEGWRVMFRNVRAETKKDIERQAGTAGVSEDDIKADVADLDKRFQKSMDELEAIGKAKETDIMKI